MASRIFHPCDTVTPFARFFRGMVRVMLCLGLWSGPTPILHAHLKTGQVIDNNPVLAQHVQICHSHDDCDYCQHWHMHFVLWGQVQPDFEDSESVPPPPPHKDMQSEFAVALSSTGVLVELARAEAQYWSFDLMGLATDFAAHTLIEGDLDRAPLCSYQNHVAASHDVARLLMVVRC